MTTETPKTMLVTGAAGGVGEAIARRFSAERWNLVLTGRQRDKLDALAATLNSPVWVQPCDVSDYGQVQSLAKGACERFGAVDVLVNAAGINLPKRRWSELSAEDFDRVISINLKGAFHCILALLPTLRERRGMVVNINSEAGRRATAKAGCAYVASKYGLAGLTESLNAEERLNGLRAVSIFPGEINTSLLDQRACPPPPEARERMVQPDDVAACVWAAVNLPERSLVEEMVVRPTYTDYQ